MCVCFRTSGTRQVSCLVQLKKKWRFGRRLGFSEIYKRVISRCIFFFLEVAHVTTFIYFDSFVLKSKLYIFVHISQS